VAFLTASNAGDKAHFGRAIAIAGAGDTIVVGAPDHRELLGGSLFSRGAAYIYERNAGGAGVWGEVAYLFSSRAVELQRDFGASVAVDGQRVIVGAPGEGLTGNQSSAGGAYVFERDPGGFWMEFPPLMSSAQEVGDRLGSSVAVRGDLIVIGAQGDRHVNGSTINQGSVYFFESTPGGQAGFSQIGWLGAANPEDNDLFGAAVSFSGPRIVVGMPGDDNAGGVDAGSAIVFERSAGSGAWEQFAQLMAGDGAAGDEFGGSVAMAGEALVVGAHLNAHSGLKSPGAAYVYELSFSAENYCTAGTSASGCQALISAAGTASASASSGFSLNIAGIEGAKDGLYFYGSNGRQANPWGSGTSFVCVIPPRWRGGLLAGLGTPGACDGSFSQDLNARWCPTCPKAVHNPGAGAMVQAQMWYRDPLSTSNQTSSMSDAIEFWVGP